MEFDVQDRKICPAVHRRTLPRNSGAAAAWAGPRLVPVKAVQRRSGRQEHRHRRPRRGCHMPRSSRLHHRLHGEESGRGTGCPLPDPSDTRPDCRPRAALHRQPVWPRQAVFHRRTVPHCDHQSEIEHRNGEKSFAGESPISAESTIRVGRIRHRQTLLHPDRTDGQTTPLHRDGRDRRRYRGVSFRQPDDRQDQGGSWDSGTIMSW